MGIVDDPDVDLRSLAARFSAWLRDRTEYADAQVRSLTQASRSNGFSNETYRVSLTSATHGDEALILRLPPARTGLFPDYDIPRQYAFMSGLQAVPGLQMAACRWVESDPAPLGRPFFVTAFVEGRVAAASPSYVRGGWIVDANPEQRRRLWDSSIEQLQRLARARWQPAGLERFDWPDRNCSRFEQHVRMWSRLAAWGHAQLPRDGADPLREELEDWLLARRPASDVAGVVWGDARFGNIIYRDFEPAALLDWELAVIGDPLIDLAYLLFHVHLTELVHGDAATPGRMSGFRGDEDTVARYCEATQRSPRDFRLCWLFNAYKMLCIWQCKAALMVRTGVWSVDQALSARRGEVLRPSIGTVLAGDADSAYLRPSEQRTDPRR